VRKLPIVVATGLLVLGMTGVAAAAVMNFAGTARVLWADHPEGVITGGGVATINNSAGVIPAHLATLRLAASRGQIEGTFTRLVTDPGVIADGVRAYEFVGMGLATGTWPEISAGAGSTQTEFKFFMPMNGIVKICLLSTACTQYLPLVLNQTTSTVVWGHTPLRAAHGGRLRRHPHLAPGGSVDDQDRDGARPDHSDGGAAADHEHLVGERLGAHTALRDELDGAAGRDGSARHAKPGDDEPAPGFEREDGVVRDRGDSLHPGAGRVTAARLGYGWPSPAWSTADAQVAARPEKDRDWGVRQILAVCPV